MQEKEDIKDNKDPIKRGALRNTSILVLVLAIAASFVDVFDERIGLAKFDIAVLLRHPLAAVELFAEAAGALIIIPLVLIGIASIFRKSRTYTVRWSIVMFTSLLFSSVLLIDDTAQSNRALMTYDKPTTDTTKVHYTKEKLPIDSPSEVDEGMAERLTEFRREKQYQHLLRVFSREGFSTKDIAVSSQHLILEFNGVKIIQTLLTTKNITTVGPTETHTVFVMGIKNGYLHSVICVDTKNLMVNAECKSKVFQTFDLN